MNKVLFIICFIYSSVLTYGFTISRPKLLTIKLSSTTTNENDTNQNMIKSSQAKVISALSLSLVLGIPLAGAASASLQNMKNIQMTPPAVVDILKDRLYQLRSGVTGEKVGQLRVGDSLFFRLRGIDTELDTLQQDIYGDRIDWDVVEIYPKIFRAFSPLFTAYTDRAFPSDQPIDNALRYALRYEVGGFYNGVKDLENAIDLRNQRQAQKAFAKMSLSYDRYLKAGDLFIEYDKDIKENTESYKTYVTQEYDNMMKGDKLNYVAPSIDAPGLQDDIILTKGPDKGRKGMVLWISKGDSLDTANAVVKFEKGNSGHSEVKLYPYSILAKTTPPDVQFTDDITAAYIASALSSGIMYPLDSFKTRQQTGLVGIPPWKEGGLFKLWQGVFYFIADANDAVYVAIYGLLRPALLSFIDIENTLAVFWVSVLGGSLGDMIGSVFRVPMEIIYKQIQTGAATNGFEVASKVLKSKGATRLIVLSWVAVLCRDMPFAGLQIALFDVFKSLLSFLDEAGVNIFIQRALWGALAGSVAAWITTPFDVLTTNVITAAQDDDNDEKDRVFNTFENQVNSPGEDEIFLPMNLPTVRKHGILSEDLISTSMSTTATTTTTTTTTTSTKVSISSNSKLTSSGSGSSSNTAVKTASKTKLSATSTDKNNIKEKQVVAVTSSSSSDNDDNILTVLSEVGPLFSQTMTDTFVNGGGISALFSGAVARMLFFGPAAMIFFATYETIFDLITLAKEGHAFWQ